MHPCFVGFMGGCKNLFSKYNYYQIENNGGFLKNSEVIMKKVLKYLFFPIFLSLVAFASTNLWCMEQKPNSQKEVLTLEVLTLNAIRDLSNIIELRADAIFCAIHESIERNAVGLYISSESLSRRNVAMRETRDAMNKASTAYLMISEDLRKMIDEIDRMAGASGVFTYTNLEEIIKNDVLKSEQIRVNDFRGKSLQFQFDVISKVLNIKDKCQKKPFLLYVKALQKIYRTVFLGHKILFLEELNFTPDTYIHKLLVVARLRNIIDLAYNSEVSLPPLKHISNATKEHRETQLKAIAQAKKMACAKLFSVAEIKGLIKQGLDGLPEALVLYDRILSLADAENSESLIHYMQIWSEKWVEENGLPKGFTMRAFSSLNSSMESFKQIFSGIDPKKSGINPENIGPNLVAKLTEMEAKILIKPESLNNGSTPESSSGKKVEIHTNTEELIAEKVAEELIAEEVGKKKKKAEKARAQEEVRKAEAELKAKEKRKVEQAHKSNASKSKKKNKNGNSEQSEVSSSSVIETAQPLVSTSTTDTVVLSVSTSSVPSIDPVDQTQSQETEVQSQEIEVQSQEIEVQSQEIEVQSQEIEEACANCVAESQFVQNWGELENPQDQLFGQFNCVVDLSRGAEGPWYQCKIFLYPELGASSENLLANLDYSRLPKYKNPRDNNHAFSNLVEKRFGHLGTITSIEQLKNGWLRITVKFPGRITWMGHAMLDAFSQGSAGSNGTFEFIILKKDMNPNSYARCVHRFFRPN
jgi:hypothetical protein